MAVGFAALHVWERHKGFKAWCLAGSCKHVSRDFALFRTKGQASHLGYTLAFARFHQVPASKRIVTHDIDTTILLPPHSLAPTAQQ